jgi:N-sulfoglucosamine sulfohydrolase
VLGAAEAPWREYLTAEFHFHGKRPFYPRRAIRDQRYKLIHNLLAGKAKPSPTIDACPGYQIAQEPRYRGTPVAKAFETFGDPPEFELYDLVEDPIEFRNLAGDPEHRETLDRLQRALLDWRKQTNDPFLDAAYVDKYVEYAKAE